MSRIGSSRGILFLAGLAAVVLGVADATPAQAVTQTLLPYLSGGYRYEIVAHGADPGFAAPGFDDSGFSTGDAAFGSGGFCPIESTVSTFWPSNTDLLTRRAVNVPAGATGIEVKVAIDNDVEVFWNGTQVGPLSSHDGCAADDSLTFTVPAALVSAGVNLLAVRAIDRGDLDYFDVSVVATGPSISMSASATSGGAAYASGTWTRDDVVVTFACTSLAGVAAVTGPVTVSAEGSGQSATGSCLDAAGATASATFSGIDIDKTPPVVAYSAHPASYEVDQAVSITCSASDALSGLASDTCQDISGPADGFAIGLNTFSATAVDRAGNTGTGSTAFTVVVDANGLCGLVDQLEPDAGIANSLCAKLRAASAAEARGDLQARAGEIDAFDHEVAVEDGRTLSAASAALLEQLAAAL